MPIEIEGTVFNQLDRPGTIRNLIGCISDDPHRILVVPRSSKAEELVYSVRESASTVLCGYTETRFRLVGGSFTGCYFEKWIRFPRGKKEFLTLNRAYFHVYRQRGVNAIESEVVLLHSDPDEPAAADHCNYKRSPHLHVCEAPAPWPHVHLALNLCNLEQVSSDLDEFTTAFRSALDMLKDQLFVEW